MSPAGWVAVQAVAAVIEAIVLARMVMPALPRLGHPRLIATVWTPVVLALPLWAVGASVRGSVAGPGWAAFGAATIIGAGGIGLSLFARSPASRTSPLPTAALAGTGAVLLLLGLANDLDEGTALIFFGLTLVLLWMGIPSLKEVRAGHERADHAAEQRAGLGLLVALGLALVQSAALLAAGRAGWRPGTALALVPAAATVVAAARLGRSWVVELSTWTTVIGVLGGIASFAVLRRVGQAGRLLEGGGMPVAPDTIAHGFGRFAFEGLLLLFLAVSVALSGDLTVAWRRVLGGGIVVLALAGGVLRLVT